jgi:hypothetical protein
MCFLKRIYIELSLRDHRYQLNKLYLLQQIRANLAIGPRRIYIYFSIMSWKPAHLQWVLGQVLGDPLHRERCIWVGDDGNHCQNTVPLDSRINGVLCFQLLQGTPFAYPLAQEFSFAAKQLLCFECRGHRCRRKLWATRFLQLLDVRQDQAEDVSIHSEPLDSALLVYQWPTSMSFNAAIAVRPDEAFSKNGKGSLAKKTN